MTLGSLAMNPHPQALSRLLWLASLVGATGGCGDDGGAETTASTSGDTTRGSDTTRGDDATAADTTAADTTHGSSSMSASSTGSTSMGSTDGSSTTAADGETTTGSTTDTGGVLPAGGTIIPLYTYPSDPTWEAVAAAKQAYPEVEVVAIINPGSGPGTMLDPLYDSGITALQDADVTVIGYVYTSYADRSADAVRTDISAYATFYPQLDGIMLDEMSNTPGDEAYYADLSGFAAGLGLGLSVGNPGTSIPESFVDSVDVLFVYESAGLPDPTSLGGWTDAYERTRFAIIPYAVPSLDAGFVSAALEHVGWVYATDDDLPNPWDTLPPYLDELMQQLAAG